MSESLTNREIVHILKEMATLYEMKEVDFKPRAYDRAAEGVQGLSEDVTDIYERDGPEGLEDIPGVGASIAKHLEELITTGHFEKYEELKEDIPVDIEEMTAVEGVGAKTVHALYKELGITTLDELEAAAEAGKLRELDGFGKKTEQNILEGITFYKEHHERFRLGDVLLMVDELLADMNTWEAISKRAVAGSVRRRKETVGDIDILIVSDEPQEVAEQFAELAHVIHVYGTGETKTSVRLTHGIDADLRVVPQESWGAALNYFTGSKAHNVELRKIAVSKDWKLNEYGLFDSDNNRLAGKTEEELYEKLGLTCIEPELREDRGEIEAARKDNLPDLVGYDDLRGDMQMHTTDSDGAQSIERMARAAADFGYEYIVITDHTQSLAMTGGLDEEELLGQIERIGEVNERLSDEGIDITVLSGSEVDILKDGSLDMDDKVLEKLDVVGAAVHSYLGLSQKEQTRRIVSAMQSPHVDIICHLTARRINKRAPILLDIEKIIEQADETGTILEIDASPERLDINDEIIRQCVDAGVKMSIDSDAHHSDHFRFISFGIAQARRGWASADDIINTKSLEEMLACLKN